MHLNIRAKVILAVSLSLISIFGIILYLLVARNVAQLRSSLNVSSKSFASLATPPIGNTFVLYQDSGSVKITEQVNKFLDLEPDVTAIHIVSVTGDQLYSSNGKSKVGSKQAESFKPVYVTDGNKYITEIVEPYFEDSGAHRYSIVYDISSQRAEQSVDSVIRLLVSAGVIILLVSIASTTWLLNRLFIRPLRDVSRSADIISSGNFDQQIVAPHHDEIGNLAAAVNKMADFLKADIAKLRDLDKMKTEFMMIASHNLRTPLTVMRGNIELAAYVKTPEQLRKIITQIQESVVRLHLLAEDMLTISTIEAGNDKMEKSPMDARKLIDSTASEFGVLAAKKQLKWQFIDSLPDGAKVNVSQSNMSSALANLLDNAIKFTKEGGVVQVSADVGKDGRLEFVVSDTGIGIAPEEMDKLFTKFHRGTSTTRYDYEGVGIGLYLTKLIVTEHGGSVSVRSEPGKGSTFTVYLPLEAGQPPAPAKPNAASG